MQELRTSRMEKSRNGVTLVQYVIIILAIFMQIAHVELKNDPFISDTKWLIKYVNKNIRNLMESQDTKYEEKEALKEYEEAVKRISLTFNDIKQNSNEMTPEKIQKIHNQTDMLRDATDRIKMKSNARKKSRLSEECAEEVRRGNYRLAITKLYLIDDSSMVMPIVKKIYNGNKENFRSIRDFGDAIPSITLSFEVYKSLKKSLDENKHFDKDIGLLFIESLKTNIIEQIAAEQSIKSEAMDFVDEIKIPVKNWLIDRLGNAISNDKLDEEAFDISERITYGLTDLQFFREISVGVMLDFYFKYESTFYEKMLNVTQKDMRSVPKLILYNALYAHTLEKYGLNAKTLVQLLMLQKGMETANEKEWKDFKTSTNELWKTTPDIKSTIISQFKFALVNGFYNEGDVDELSKALIRADAKIFEDVIRMAVNGIYSKTKTVDLIAMFRGSTEIGQSVIGYEAVFDKMNEKGDLAMEIKNFGALLKLEYVVTETMQMKNLRFVHINIVSKLKRIQNHLTNLKSDISKIFNQAVNAGNYTTDQYKLLCEQIFEAKTFWHFITTLVSELYPSVNTEKLIDYMISLPLFEQKIVGLYALNNQIPNTNENLFVVAQYSKSLTDSQQYPNIGGEFKVTVRNHYNSLPSSIRHAVHAKHVYIKNLSWGGEYLYIADNFNQSKNMKQIFSQVTWRTGNRTKFILEYSGEYSYSVYKIKTAERNEYLFASDDEFNFDSNSRRVFAQIGGTRSGRDKWRLIPATGGLYIKNHFYKEYLFTDKEILDEEKRQIFTWRPGVQTYNSKWAIEDATSGY